MLNGPRRLVLVRIPVLVVIRMRPAISRGVPGEISVGKIAED
jgi:hypothetical protein